MRRLTDRLWDIKERLAPLLQPITEAELYMLLHNNYKDDSCFQTSSTDCNAMGLSVREK